MRKDKQEQIDKILRNLTKSKVEEGGSEEEEEDSISFEGDKQKNAQNKLGRKHGLRQTQHHQTPMPGLEFVYLQCKANFMEKELGEGEEFILRTDSLIAFSDGVQISTTNSTLFQAKTPFITLKGPGIYIYIYIYICIYIGLIYLETVSTSEATRRSRSQMHYSLLSYIYLINGILRMGIWLLFVVAELFFFTFLTNRLQY